ncbi:TPA: hypothetical protein ENS27_11770 [bacterium]|nr:hypothetical protein [bacterium]
MKRLIIPLISFIIFISILAYIQIYSCSNLNETTFLLENKQQELSDKSTNAKINDEAKNVSIPKSINKEIVNIDGLPEPINMDKTNWQSDKIRYVKANDKNSFNTIQQAIDSAKDGDIVLVANGIYRGEGNVNIDFKGKAITVKSENGPKNCIIDCEAKIGTRGFTFRNKETGNSIVDGFTIKNGNNSGEYPNTSGGGIYCASASPIIRNNIIINNSALNGGGIFSDGKAAPIIENNIIANNLALREGGGILLSYANSVIRNNIIARNTSRVGSGLWLAFCSVKLINNTIADNTVIIEKESLGCVIVCSLSNLEIVNTIVWNEDVPKVTPIIFGGNTEFNISHSVIQGGRENITINGGQVIWGDSNIDTNPMFINVQKGRYQLSEDSPFIRTNIGAFIRTDQIYQR